MPETYRFPFRQTTVTVIKDDSGDPWFVAKDVCDSLDVGNVSQALDRLDADEKSVICLNDSAGRPNDMLIISEPGLYRLVLSSRKQIAKEFQRWVTHEVLPQIRKTGKYHVPTLPPYQLPTLDDLAAHIRFLDSIGMLEDRDRFMVADCARTLLQRRLGTGATDEPVRQPGFDTEDILGRVAPHLTPYQRSKCTSTLGKALAREYRSRFHVPDPPKTQRFIGGKSREVNWYRDEDADWATAIVQNFLAIRGMLTPPSHVPPELE